MAKKGLDLLEVKELKLDTSKEMKCVKCNKFKPYKSFTGKVSKINNKYYFNYTCNSCLYKKKLVKYEDRNDSYKAKQKDREVNTINGRASRLKNGCKQRAREHNFEFDLDIDIIRDKLEKGICEKTGIKFEFTSFDYNPLAPSIDRIDSNKGYTNDNIQIVCMIYNFCKNKFTEEQVQDFFNKIKNGEKKE